MNEPPDNSGKPIGRAANYEKILEVTCPECGNLQIEAEWVGPNDDGEPYVCAACKQRFTL